MAVATAPVAGEKAERFFALHTHEEHDDPEVAMRFGEHGCVLTDVYESSARAVKDFAVRQDDVWVITPPKCGTTWTQEMVWLLMHDFDYEEAKAKLLSHRFPYLEFARFLTDSKKQQFLGGMDTLDFSAKLPSPRCIKSHLPKDLLPDQLWTKKPKIIYVAREPKDVAVSFFYHDQLLTSYSGDRDFFFECFYDDIVGYAPFWEHILDFWKMKDEPNILFNTYEEMKRDLPSVIRRTAHFLGKEVTNEQVTRLAEHLDFTQMKNNPSVNVENALSKMREIGRIKDDQAFIRKGVVGEGQREMSPEMAARFDERTRRVFNEEVGGCPWDI